MLYRDICKILGYYLFGLSAALIIPLLVAGYYEFIADPTFHPQPHSSLSFIETIAISLVIAFCFYWIGRKTKTQLYRREGLAIVVIIWVLTPAISALPFLLSGTLQSPFQSYFEAISGLTATGSSVMEAKNYDPLTGKEIPITRVIKGALDTPYVYYGTIEPVRDPHTHQILYEGLDAVSKGILFWRSFVQFLGGGGIVVLFVAILPALGVGGRVLIQTEMPSSMKEESLTPRIKETAYHLWKIYLGLTLLQTILLMATNFKMSLFDALTISFGTLATGGFTVRNGGIAAYHSTVTDWVVVAFMILGSLNFSLYFHILRGKFYRIYQPELLIYLIAILATGFLSAWYLVGTEKELLVPGPKGVFTVGEALTHGFFQMVSVLSTTGFALANYDKWPYVIQAMMMITLFVGGMSGSTSGGIKIFRLYTLFRLAKFKIESLFRSEMVRKFYVGDNELDSRGTLWVLIFFFMFISTAAFGTFLYVVSGCDLETAMTMSSGMVNCDGIGFRAAGPDSSCAFLSDFGLVLSSLLMLLGRLEFFAVLALFVPAFWKQK